MRSSIHFIALATAIAWVLPATADARPRRASHSRREPPAAPAAPMPPTPPTPPQLAMHAPLAPMPPAAVLAIAAPPAPPAFPPGASFSFSFGKGRLGVQVSSMTPELRVFFGAPDGSGLLVQGVDTDTPASKAGVSVGDVIVVVDGDDVDGIEDVAAALSDRGSGDSVAIEVVRGKQRRSLKAELREQAGPSFTSGTFPGGSIQVFDDSGVHEDLAALRERMEQLERRLEVTPPKQRAKPKQPKARGPAAKKT